MFEVFEGVFEIIGIVLEVALDMGTGRTKRSSTRLVERGVVR